MKKEPSLADKIRNSEFLNSDKAKYFEAGFLVFLLIATVILITLAIAISL